MIATKPYNLIFVIIILLNCFNHSVLAKSTLDIYFPDMMGGTAILIVTPLGESVLIDTGHEKPKHRDAERIYEVIRLAELLQIDYIITTHFHSDHYGGLFQLSEMISIKNYYDKGKPPPEITKPSIHSMYSRYKEITKGKRKTLHPGDEIALKKDPQGTIPHVKLSCIAAEKKIWRIK